MGTPNQRSVKPIVGCELDAGEEEARQEEAEGHRIPCSQPPRVAAATDEEGTLMVDKKQTLGAKRLLSMARETAKQQTRKPVGWVKEPVRHGLASKGVKTAPDPFRTFRTEVPQETRARIALQAQVLRQAIDAEFGNYLFKDMGMRDFVARELAKEGFYVKRRSVRGQVLSPQYVEDEDPELKRGASLPMFGAQKQMYPVLYRVAWDSNVPARSRI